MPIKLVKRPLQCIFIAFRDFYNITGKRLEWVNPFIKSSQE